MSLWNPWRSLHWQVRFWSRLGHVRTSRSKPLPASPRVLHLSPSWFADASCVGGGERYPTELASAMSEIVPTTLLSFAGSPSAETQGSLALRWIAGRPLGGNESDPLPGKGLVGAILRCDVLHAHQWRTAATQLATAIAAGLGKRVFVSDHGNVATDLSGRYKLEKLVTGFLPVSNFAARFLPCPADTEGLSGGVPQALLAQAPGPWPREPRVIFLGRLLPHKGLDVLVRACGSELPLTLVGRPYHRAYLDHLRELSAGGRVEFVLDADDAQVAARLRQASVLVLPSVHRDMYGTEYVMPELLGLVLLEAMACGTPVVCTDAGAMSEFVIEGKTGRVVPWGDPVSLGRALREIVYQPGLAEEMGRNARLDVEARHTWRHVADRCLQAYRR